MAYEEFWDDSSKLDELLPSAAKNDIKIGQAYTLYKEILVNNQLQ